MSSRDILLEQLPKVCAKHSIEGLLAVLARAGCPPDTETYLCNDTDCSNTDCKECWRGWLKFKLYEEQHYGK